jgi:predicted acylesterase/phospholipase RssA/CRP-like cAMP-binding protein
MTPAARDAHVLAGLDAGAVPLERLSLPAGAELYRAGDFGDTLYVVESGRLLVRGAAGEDDPPLHAVLPGETVGELHLLRGGRRTATVVAAEDSVVAQLPAALFRRADAHALELPQPLLARVRAGVRRRQLVSALRRLLGPLEDHRLREIERVADWVRLSRGEALVHQGDGGNDVWVLVSGRLRALREDAAGPVVLGDIGQGESIGEMAFFTGEERSATVVAIRDSDLLRFSGADFDALLRGNPEAARQVTRLVVDRLRRLYAPRPPAPIRTIALAAVGPGVDLPAFARRLAGELHRHGPARCVEPADVEGELGRGTSRIPPGDPLGAALETWLDEQELAHRFVVLPTTADASGWDARCAARADQILLVAAPDAGPVPAAMDAASAEAPPAATAPRRALVLVHEPTKPLPSGTATWLNAFQPDAHYHLRGTGDAEFQRLARILAGRAVGVVLGGGGARGFAHIGVLRALGEAGVPIDFIGGTSMGASMAAQHAMGWDAERMLRANREAWIDLRPHKEYTLPLLSILKGRKAGLMGRMLYGDVLIEDLWTPYYCVSTNLTLAEQRVHRLGSLRIAATASASLPAVVTPVVDNGELLVDGAILNNLPVDVMREVGAGVVLAVDVSTDEELTYGDEAFPTPWALLRDRLLRRPRRAVPTLGEVLLRCTMLGSVNRGAATRGLANFYLRPPLELFGLMEFTALDRAAAVGYTYTLEKLEEWRETPLFGIYP